MVGTSNPRPQDDSTPPSEHPQNGGCDSCFRLAFAVDQLCQTLTGIEMLVQRIEDMEERIGGIDARLYASLDAPYPAGPFGMQIFKTEDEARLFWRLLMLRIYGSDQSKWEPFPTLPALERKEAARIGRLEKEQAIPPANNSRSVPSGNKPAIRARDLEVTG